MEISKTKLSKKVKDFVAAYEGNIVEAMRQAGYVGDDRFLEESGLQLLRQPPIAAAIKEKSLVQASAIRMVAQKEELQVWWSHLVRNEDPHSNPTVDSSGITADKDIPLATRIKASEMLMKSHGGFVEKIDINSNVTVSHVIQEAYSVDDNDLDAIEAEYVEIREKKRIATEGRTDNPFPTPPKAQPQGAEDLI